MAIKCESPQEIERRIQEELFYIVSNFEKGLIRLAAVGCERVASLYLILDKEEIAELYLKQAMLYYESLEAYIEASRLADYLGDKRMKTYIELEALNEIGKRKGIIDKKLEERILELLVDLDSFLEEEKRMFNIVRVIKDKYGIRIVHVYPELDE